MRIPECGGADNSEVLKAHPPAFTELHVRPTYHLPDVNPSSPRMKIEKIEIVQKRIENGTLDVNGGIERERDKERKRIRVAAI